MRVNLSQLLRGEILLMVTRARPFESAKQTLFSGLVDELISSEFSLFTSVDFSDQTKLRCFGATPLGELSEHEDVTGGGMNAEI